MNAAKHATFLLLILIGAKNRTEVPLASKFPPVKCAIGKKVPSLVLLEFIGLSVLSNVSAAAG